MDPIEVVVVVVVCVLAIAGANMLAPRVRLAAPLLLVLVGVVVSYIPRVPPIHVEPEIILIGVLPPLLFAAAVALPAMDFKRDFQAISGLSIVLVIISALVLGAFFYAILPDINYATGVALGAILSPTDAVATGTIKRVGAPNRLITVLSGESLFNDASALVVLRAAIAASAASVSLVGVAASFVWALIGAVVVGAAVGWAVTRVRSRISNPAVATAVSFTAPYLAYVPAELMEASGLVAAVAAGLVVGRSSVRVLTAAHRQSDIQNWRTVEVVLEGAVFLVMGLQLKSIVDDVRMSHETIWHALWPAVVALAILLAIRLAFVMPLVAYLDRHLRRLIAWEPTLSAMKDSLDNGGAAPDTSARRYQLRISRRLADIDYYRTESIGTREGLVVVWAGMRGVVTLAAAQTLPAETPYRSLLILVAFFVATISLLVQGGTIEAFVKAMRLPDTTQEVRDERHRLQRELGEIAANMMRDPAVIGYDPGVARRVTLLRELEKNTVGDDEEDALDVRLAMARKLRKVRRQIIVEQRNRLIELRNSGSYSTEALSQELAKLDTEEISLSTDVQT